MRYFRVALFVVAACVAGDLLAAAPGYRKGQATALEIAALPTFCLWEYDEAFASTRNELRQSNCRVGMNHYCGALVAYMRGKKERKKGIKLQKLSIALRETEYTLKWGLKLDKSPNCVAVQHATQMFHEIRATYKAAGGKPPKSEFEDTMPDDSKSSPPAANPADPGRPSTPAGSSSPQRTVGGTPTSDQNSTRTYPPATAPPSPIKNDDQGLIGN